MIISSLNGEEIQKGQDSNSLPPQHQRTVSSQRAHNLCHSSNQVSSIPSPIPQISLQPNPKPPPKLPHILQREQGIRIIQRDMSSSGYRGSDLWLRSLQLFGHSHLPLPGVPTAKFELVKAPDRGKDENLGQS